MGEIVVGHDGQLHRRFIGATASARSTVQRREPRPNLLIRGAEQPADQTELMEVGLAWQQGTMTQKLTEDAADGPDRARGETQHRTDRAQARSAVGDEEDPLQQSLRTATQSSTRSLAVTVVCSSDHMSTAE